MAFRSLAARAVRRNDKVGIGELASPDAPRGHSGCSTPRARGAGCQDRRARAWLADVVDIAPARGEARSPRKWTACSCQGIPGALDLLRRRRVIAAQSL